jgi:hypothetical protein
MAKAKREEGPTAFVEGRVATTQVAEGVCRLRPVAARQHDMASVPVQVQVQVQVHVQEAGVHVIGSCYSVDGSCEMGAAMFMLLNGVQRPSPHGWHGGHGGHGGDGW